MAHVLKHSQCPQCAKRGADRGKDNLARYSDGHSYCFSCGYYGHPLNSISNMKKKLYKYKTEENPYEFHNRRNVTYSLPNSCLLWLSKYRITPSEIIHHGFFYDKDKDLLVMPVLDGDRTVFTSSRYFGTDPTYSKYVSKGYKTQHFKLVQPKEPSSVYVVVEDYISAIRVGRSYNCIPLFGSFAPRELVISLCARRAILRFWLDRNKASEAASQAAHARQWIPDCATIITEKDPKEYTDEQIRDYVNASLLQPIASVSKQGSV